MGRTGTEWLLKIITKERSPMEEVSPLDVQLIVRESTGRAPSKGNVL
jgi:DNA-binding LacI/PurR family transcriptional regulator